MTGRISRSKAAPRGRLVRGEARQAVRRAREGVERRRLEGQFQQSQKLVSLGTLAGGVAHDLNNVLGAILNLASTHKDAPGLDPSLAAALETIVTACMRGRGVVRSLLHFARGEGEAGQALDLNAIVRDLALLLAHTTLKRVRLDLDLEDGLPGLRGDAGALSHAVMNLCVNAVDAMAGGGTLALGTRREGDGGLSLWVADTGGGMSEKTLLRAAEPFFTTKAAGQGTGLGLPMVISTMKAHGGSLELQSRPGEGTKAWLRFPAARVVPRAPRVEPVPGKALVSAPKSILLVDDDELVREAMAPMLEALGHRVTLACGGQEALNLFRGGLEVDLVILDMNMPGLNGAETLVRLLEMRPDQRVLLASGYTDVNLAALTGPRPNVASLRKPFSLGELREHLARFT